MQWKMSAVSEELIEDKAKEWGTSKFLTKVLIKKGLNTKQEVKEFLNPSFNQLRDPFDFEMMSDVVQKIIEAKKLHKKIYVYGDYDVDGITGAVFLVLVLRELNIEADYCIPSRMDEGYGLNRANIDYIYKNKGELIITVDTGINSKVDIEYAKSLGIDIIITDHHKSVKNDEEGNLYINPKLSENYKFKYLAGAGVALKVAQALCLELNEDFNKIYQYIEIVMIGTVADVVPMYDENRIIISKGLKNLRKTKIKGLSYLNRYLKLYNKEVSTTDISYFVSPLINSLGRMGNSKLAADFFINDDEFEVYNIIEEMKKANKQRREYEKAIFDDAIEELKDKDISQLNLIFLASERWHPGVIGVAASRLSVKYNLPVIIISLKDGIAKGSCRSIAEVNIFDILKSIEDKLIRFGGHDYAAGFIAEESRLQEIKDVLERDIEAKDIVKTEKEIEILQELKIEDITDKYMSDILKLSPFGLENEPPYFKDNNIEIENINFFGVSDKHFKGVIRKNNISYPVVAFDLTNKLDKEDNKRYEIIYYPELITTKDNRSILQIRLKDLSSI